MEDSTETLALLSHNQKSAGLLLLASWSLVALLLTPSELSAQATAEQIRAALQAADESSEPFPRNVLSAVFGFDADRLTRLDREEVVTGEALFDGTDEVAVVGAVRLEGDRDRFVRTLDPAWRYRTSDRNPGSGVFSDPPRLQDLEGLVLAESTIDEIRKCRPGKCGLQLSSAAMSRLQSDLDWESPDAAEELQHRFRQLLHGYVVEYSERGFAGTGVYEDARRPIDRTQEFREVLGHAMILAREEPVLHDYLDSFPQRPKDNVRDIYYWAQTDGSGWGKPTIMLVHGVVWTDPDDPTRVSYVDRLIYASHYAVASLGETEIIADKTSPQHFYVVRNHRIRFRIGGGVAHRLVMGRVHDGTRMSLEAELEMAKQIAVRGR